MFVAITSVSLKLKLESGKYQQLPGPDAPSVAKSWRLRVKGENVTSICQTKADTQFLQKSRKYDFWGFRCKMGVSGEKVRLVGQFEILAQDNFLRSCPTGRTPV